MTTIFLTGGTGLIGSAVLQHLRETGHDVRALARSDASAAAVEAAGATPVPGEHSDVDLVAAEAAACDGVIHTAASSDGHDDERDDAFTDAVLRALAGSDRPYVHTSGIWVHGAGQALTEHTPFAPPPVTAWRLPIDAKVRAAAGDGVRTVVISPGVVYGRGAGLPALIKNGPRRDRSLLYPGGDQHWTTVHVDDLAALYVLALDRAPAGEYYLGISGENPLLHDVAIAASHTDGLDLRVEVEPEAESRARLGPLHDALVLDQQGTGEHARELGWKPQGPTLIDDMATGSYSDDA